MASPSRKIFVIGPVVPYRGGIAQHTTQLANALAKIVDTSVISFSCLYPRWLYPGRFQTEESGLSLTPPVEFILDSANPFTWRRVAALVEAQSPSCVIIPWWTFFLAPCLSFMARRLIRQGIPVVFFCHNVVDHEAAIWKRMLAKAVLRHGAGFVVQTHDEEAKLRNLLGDIEVLYHPHPVYDQFPPARYLLPRRARVELLFYGFIRPYKGLDILLDAMAGLSDLDVRLTIAGEPWGEHENSWRKRISDAGLEDKLEFVPRYLSDEESAEYFARADAVVLPYRSATGTGVVAAAYHYRKPVIASAVGGLKDVVIEGETGFLVPSADADALRNAIRRFTAEGIPGAAVNIGKLIEKMTWTNLAERLLDTVQRIAEHQGTQDQAADKKELTG